MDKAKNMTQESHAEQVRKTLLRPKQDHYVQHFHEQLKEGKRDKPPSLPSFPKVQI